MDPRANRKTESRASRVLLRGESTIASGGLLLAAIVFCSMAASAWWSARTQDQAHRESRIRSLESVGDLLAEMTGAYLSDDKVGRVRLLVSDAARRHGLTNCRVVLPEGQVIAAASATQITLASLPTSWTSEDVSETDVPLPTGDHVITFPIIVPDRGAARLDLVTALEQPALLSWSAQTGIGIIGAAALFALLLVYRNIRSRMRSLSYIRESLLALDAGETSLAALTICNDLGPEAAAWNELVSERESLQQVLVTKRLLELPSARQERSHDLTSMCDAMPQGLLLVDHNLLITYANGAAGLYLGTSREQILGTTIEGTVDDPAILDAVRGVAAGTLRRSTSIEMESTAGSAHTILRISVRPVRRDDESSAMIVVEDVTQQRLASAAGNTFVAQVTHELRTPLTNILLYAETAMDNDQEDPHERARALNVINQEAKRLDRIVGDMLSVAEIEAGTHEVRIDDVRLSGLFEELSSDYAAQAKEKDIKLEFNLPPKLPVIQADRDKISLAVHNLIGNALKYTPAGGVIVVDVDCDDRRVVIKVIDNGIGMESGELERIFEKFYRAKDHRIAGVTGSGLGLALAREVIRLHGGDIAVESAVDKGSTFTLTVPIVRAAAAA